MLGCFERGLYPGQPDRPALLPGIAVPAEQGCCGALHAHNGESEQGRELAGGWARTARRHRHHGRGLRRAPGRACSAGTGCTS